MTMRWHYTKGVHLASICESGVIRPATAFVARGERPAVWFSTAPIWEPTAGMGLSDDGVEWRTATMKETASKAGGVFRFGVAPETAPYDWEAFCRLSHVTAKVAADLLRSAERHDSDPSMWYVSFKPVPRPEWLTVEAWYVGRWQAIDIDALDDDIAI